MKPFPLNFSGPRLLAVAAIGLVWNTHARAGASDVRAADLAALVKEVDATYPFSGSNGIQPDIELEAVPEEVAQGLNSEIRRAEEHLAEQQPQISKP